MADRTSYLDLTFKHAIDETKRREGVDCCVQVRVDVTNIPISARLRLHLCLSLKQILCVRADRCVHPRPSVTDCLLFCQLLMPMLCLPGRCIAFVPISPDVMKIPLGAWFGYAGLLRDLVMWGDHPRWSRRRHVASICWF